MVCSWLIINLRHTEAEAPLQAKTTTKSSGKQEKQTKKKTSDEKTRSEKRVHILERNRIAAGKCRKRKKATISTLEEKCHILKARNTAMRELAWELMREMESLRALAQLHEVGNCAVNIDDGGSEGVKSRTSIAHEVDVKLEEEMQIKVGLETEAG